MEIELNPSSQGQGDSSYRAAGGVAAALADAGGQLVPVTIVMSDQVPREEMDSARSITSKAERREVVVAMLKGLAEARLVLAERPFGIPAFPWS